MSLPWACDDLLDHVHVGGGADERKSDRVHAVVEAELEILTIFFGHGGNRQRCAGQIDALVFAQSSAVQDVADNVFAAHGAHAQFDQAVAQQNARAGGNFAGEIGKGGGNAGRSAGDVARGDDHGRTAFELDGFVALQASSADLRALQILENADGAIFLLGGEAQALDVVGVVFVGAVGKIQAGNVHAEAKQVAHGGLRVAGGADGADDFGAAGCGDRVRQIGNRRGEGVLCCELWLVGLHFFVVNPPLSTLRLVIPSAARDLGSCLRYDIPSVRAETKIPRFARDDKQDSARDDK